jgi:hypothetical protein
MQLRVRVPRVEAVHPTRQTRRYQTNRFKSVVESINFKIADQLNKHSANPIRIFKIENICNSFKEYLANEFGLTKRYSVCKEFLESFPIATSNQIDPNTRFYIDESSFSIKFNNQRSRTTKGVNGTKKYFSAASISIKFKKKRHHQFDNAAMDILARFYN